MSEFTKEIQPTHIIFFTGPDYDKEIRTLFYLNNELKNEAALLVFTEAQEVTKLRQELKEENEQLKSLYIKVSSENQNLKKRVDNLEKSIDEVKDIKEKLAKFLTTEK